MPIDKQCEFYCSFCSDCKTCDLMFSESFYDDGMGVNEVRRALYGSSDN